MHAEYTKYHIIGERNLYISVCTLCHHMWSHTFNCTHSARTHEEMHDKFSEQKRQVAVQAGRQ